MAKLVKMDGTIEEYDYVNASLDELQETLDGYAQWVHLPDEGGAVVCDEDGKPKGLSVNKLATEMYHQAWGQEMDCLVGDVIFITLAELEEKD